MAEEWTSAVDANTGKTYYYNKATRQTTWKNPYSDWAATIDQASGKTYYYNKKTKETTWTKPPELQEPLSPTNTPPTSRTPPASTTPAPQDPTAKKLHLAANPAADLLASAIRASSASVSSPSSVRPEPSPSAVSKSDPPEEEKTEENGTARSSKKSIDSAYEALTMYASTTMKVRGAHVGIQLIFNADDFASSPTSPDPGRKPSLVKHDSMDLDSGVVRTDRISSQMARNATVGRKKIKSKPSSAGSDEDYDSEDDNPDIADGEMKEVIEGADKVVRRVKLKLATHRKGWAKRTFKVGNAQDETVLLSYKKSLIKKSLLKANRKWDKLAIECFKEVMCAMGDRDTSRSPAYHAMMLIRYALASKMVNIRDEICLQVCKQVTNHPKLDHAIIGWELMSVLVGSFSVSNDMKMFLEDVIEAILKDEFADLAIKRLGELVVQRLAKGERQGCRVELPTPEELQRDFAGEPFPIRVYTMDGEPWELNVDCYTTVSQVRDEMLSKLNIRFSRPFNIAQMNGSWEEHVNCDTRIMDLYSSWQRVPPEQRFSSEEYCRLIFRAELMAKTKDKRLKDDVEALKWTYQQACYYLNKGTYSSQLVDVIALAAYQLQVKQGEYRIEKHSVKWIFEVAGEILPSSLTEGYKSNKKKSSQIEALAQQIALRYTGLTGISGVEARLMYLDTIQEQVFYGSNVFVVDQIGLKKLPSTIKVLIGTNALILMHKKKDETFEMIGWERVNALESTPEKLTLKYDDTIVDMRNEQAPIMHKLAAGYIMLRDELASGNMASFA